MAKLSESELIEIIEDAHIRVTTGRYYRHRNGGRYFVQSIALEEATLKPVVVYWDAKGSGVGFTRPLDEFLERFTLEGD